MLYEVSKNSKIFNFKIHAKYTGFFDFNSPEGPVFSWSGCSIQTNFRGTDIAIKLKDISLSENNWINVIIDNNEPEAINVLPGKDTYVIAEELKDEVHNVEIHKRTEALLGQLQFCGFVLPSGGEFLMPPPESSRKIEIIGDSITCGAGNEGLFSGIEAEFLGKEENNYMAYGSIAARTLDADLATISVSGSGCYQNYGGVKENTLGDLYLNTNPSMSYDIWNSKRWVPNAAIVNLGTNDFSAEIDTDGFKEKYRKLIKHIRSKYPETLIICSIGSMNLEAGTHINSIVKELNAEGDNNIVYLEFELQNSEEDGLGWGGHPTVKTHKKMAQKLVNQIKQKLNW